MNVIKRNRLGRKLTQNVARAIVLYLGGVRVSWPPSTTDHIVARVSCTLSCRLAIGGCADPRDNFCTKRSAGAVITIGIEIVAVTTMAGVVS